MPMHTERELIADYGRRMSTAGLCPGTSGNLSVYDAARGLMAVSPSGLSYHETRAWDVVVMDLDGKIADGARRPSSEWGLHAGFYRAKPDIGAVVHTHSMYCTVFAVLGREIEPVHYAMLASGVERVPCAPYRTFGTPELAEAAVEQNHIRPILRRHPLKPPGQHLFHHRKIVVGNGRILDIESAVRLLVEPFRSGHDHRPHRITALDVRIVVNLDPFRHFRQSERPLHFKQIAADGIFQRHFAFQRFFGIVSDVGGNFGFVAALINIDPCADRLA